MLTFLSRSAAFIHLGRVKSMLTLYCMMTSSLFWNMLWSASSRSTTAAVFICVFLLLESFAILAYKNGKASTGALVCFLQIFRWLQVLCSQRNMYTLYWLPLVLFHTYLSPMHWQPLYPVCYTLVLDGTWVCETNNKAKVNVDGFAL